MACPSKLGQARTENCWRSIRAVCIAAAMKLKERECPSKEGCRRTMMRTGCTKGIAMRAPERPFMNQILSWLVFWLPECHRDVSRCSSCQTIISLTLASSRPQISW
jgi:hypothetical protein